MAISYNEDYNEQIRKICSTFKNYHVVLRSARYRYLHDYIMECTGELFRSAGCEATLGKRICFILHGFQDFPICGGVGCGRRILGRRDISWNSEWPVHCSLKCSANDERTVRKRRETSERVHGNPNFNGDREELKRRNRERWGSDWFFSSEEGKRSIRETWKRNGYDHPMQSETLRKEMSERYMRKHGVPYSCLDHEVMVKSRLPYLYDGKYFGSSWELAYYIYLKDKGADFTYQPEEHFEYEDGNGKTRYYFPDFKVDGRFVEIKGDQFIGKDGKYRNPYDSGHSTDGIYEAKRRCMEKNGVTVLTKTDMDAYNSYCIGRFGGDSRWRLAFKVHGRPRNSISDTEDLVIGFDPGNMMREFEYFRNREVGDITSSYGTKNAIVKYFQQDVFFAREREMWKDAETRRRLVENRCRFLGKREDELTVSDVLSGFKHSGIHWGYSHFNPLLFKWFIGRYGVRTCYDPCGGWGHRLLGGLSLERYVYNDLSERTKGNVDRMISFFGLENTVTYCEDARTFEPPEDFGAMFTCPPYFNTETYECGGFSDIGDFNSFLDSLFGVFRRRESCKVFGLVLRENLLPENHVDFSESFRVSSDRSSYLGGNRRKSPEYLYVYLK